MNKLLTKIVGAALGLTMAVGVGISVGASRRDAVPVSAATVGTSYNVSSTAATSITNNGLYVLKQGSNGFTGTIASNWASVTTKKSNYFILKAVVSDNTFTLEDYDGTNGYVYCSAAKKIAWDSTNKTSFTLMTGKKTTNISNAVGNSTVGTLQYNSSGGFRPYTTATGADAQLFEVTAETTYTITYHANGGSGTMSNTTGENPSVAECTFTAPSTNKTFGYWHTAADGTSGTTYSVGAQPKQNLDLYAIWKDKPTLLSIAITTPPSKTSYNSGETFDSTGMVVTATYSDTSTANVVSSCTFTPSGALSTSDSSITVSYTYEGITKTANQTITVTRAPGLITFGSESSNYNFANAPYTPAFTDNLGSTVTTEVDTTGNISATQIGKGDVDSTATVTITLGSRSGIKSVTVNAAASQYSGTVNIEVYGDTTNDVILSDSVTGQSYKEVTISNSYKTINANKIVVVFSGSTGLKPGSISYVLTDTVNEFGTLDKIEVKVGSTHETIFKVGQTFSSTRLVIVATDTTDFTKEFTSGFTTNFDGHEFVAGDVANGVEVTVSLTLGSITKTTKYTIDIINPPTYSAATDLFEGMKVILMASNKSAVGDYATNQYNVVTDMTVSDEGIVTDSTNALEFTVRIFGDAFGLQYRDKYLSYSGSGNEAHQSNVLNANASWKLDGTGILWCGNESAERYFQINGTIKAACYTSTQNHLSLYVSSHSSKTPTLGAETFAFKYLHMRDYDVNGTRGSTGGNGSCKSYYSVAATAYTGLSTQEKSEFAKLTSAVQRFEDWAIANGYTFDASAGTLVQNSAARISGLFSDGGNNVATTIIVVVSLVSITAIVGYFFVRKRKEQ